MLTGSREQPSTQAAIPPQNQIPPEPNAAPPAQKPAELPAPETSAPLPSPPPRPEDPEIREAWVRSQLHTISESLKKEQDRGVKKLLKSLLPGKSDDALQ